MSLANCNLAKAASAICSTKDLGDHNQIELYSIGDDSYTFNVNLGDKRLTVFGSPNSIIYEISVAHSHPHFGHPQSKYKLQLLESESNDTYVNAVRLAIAALDIQLESLSSSLDVVSRTVFEDTTSYEVNDQTDDKDTPANYLDKHLTTPLPKDWQVEYKLRKDPNDKDSIDKYADIDLGDVDMDKVCALKNFFDDVYDDMYSDFNEVNPMMLKSVRDAVNWVLAKVGSKHKLDSKTVLAALMSCSLDSKHVVFNEKDKICDTLTVNVPYVIFDLVILHRNASKK